MKNHANLHDKELAREQFYFSTAIENEEFKNTLFFRMKIGVLCRFFKTDTIHVSFERITKLFQKTKAISIRKIFK